MTRDTLFLLPPGFFDNERREYCPECAEIWGLLSYYPAIKESLQVIYQPIAKPRADIVMLYWAIKTKTAQLSFWLKAVLILRIAA